MESLEVSALQVAYRATPRAPLKAIAKFSPPPEAKRVFQPVVAFLQLDRAKICLEPLRANQDFSVSDVRCPHAKRPQGLARVTMTGPAAYTGRSTIALLSAESLLVPSALRPSYLVPDP